MAEAEETMRLAQAAVAAGVLAAATVAMAQESGIRVRSIRVLATGPVEIATFCEKAFGMSETRRPVETPTFTEIVINSGSTSELARKATTTPIVIATRRETRRPVQWPRSSSRYRISTRRSRP
jgi:hypothetical protein